MTLILTHSFDYELSSTFVSQDIAIFFGKNAPFHGGRTCFRDNSIVYFYLWFSGEYFGVFGYLFRQRPPSTSIELLPF